MASESLCDGIGCKRTARWLVGDLAGVMLPACDLHIGERASLLLHGKSGNLSIHKLDDDRYSG